MKKTKSRKGKDKTKATLEKPHKTRKLSYHDKVEATLRHPEFIKDYEVLKTLEEKYNQVDAIQLDDRDEEFNIKFNEKHQNISDIFMRIVACCSYITSKWEISIDKITHNFSHLLREGILSKDLPDCIKEIKNPFEYLFKNSLLLTIDQDGERHLKRWTIRPDKRLDFEWNITPNNEDRLYLEIDLKYPKDDLVDRFEEIIKEYKKLFTLKTSTLSNDPRSFKPFEVYDIVVEKYGMVGSLDDLPHGGISYVVRKYYKKTEGTFQCSQEKCRQGIDKAKNAYSNAIEMIEERGRKVLGKDYTMKLS
jgi:hypothetical protein